MKIDFVDAIIATGNNISIKNINENFIPIHQF